MQTVLYSDPTILSKLIAQYLAENNLQIVAKKEEMAWTIEDCAAYLKCSKAHVREMVASKRIPFRNIGKPGSKAMDLRFCPEAIREWFMNNKDF